MEGLMEKLIEAMKESEERAATRLQSSLDRWLQGLKEELKQERAATRHTYISTPTTTDVDPKAGVQELEATHDNAAELATSAASAQPLAIDATGVAAPTPPTCSTDGSNQVVAINSLNKVTTVCPDLAIDLNTTTAVLPELAVVRNDKEVEQLPSHAVTEEDAAPGVITTDVFTQRVSPVTTVVYDNVNKIAAPAATVLLTTECSRSCLPDTLKLSLMAMAFPQVWRKWMRLRQTPWPSFWMDHAEGNKVRPIPWPSFLIGRFMEHLIHDNSLISSTFLMELSHVGNLVCDLPGNCIRILPGQLLCLWSLQQDGADSCLNTHVKLFHYSKQWFSELCAFTEHGQLTFLVSTEHNCGSEMICACAHPGTNSKDFTIQSALPSSFEQLQWGIAWTLSFVRKTTDGRPCLRHNFQFLLPPGNPRAVQVWSDLHIVEFIEHQFINHAQISELAACFYLEKLWGTSDLVYKSQEQWKFCEHRRIEHDAAVCNFSRPDKLKGTMQTMSKSVNWPFLSQREYKRRGHLDQKCTSKQITGGSRAKIQLTVLLVTFECCSPFCATMLGGNAYHLLMVQIIATLLSNLPEKYLLDDATGTVHHLIRKSIGAELQQHVTQPGNYFALFQPNSPRPVHIVILAHLSLFSKQTITESLHVKTASWTLINFEVLVLPDSMSVMLFSLLSTRKWGIAGGFLLDIIFSILRCPSQDISELDGMVGKVEQIAHMDNPIHQLVEQQMSLPEPDENASMHEHVQAAIGHKSWDPGSTTMPTSHLQPSKVTVAMIISKEARAVGGMASCTLSGQEPVQGGGCVIVVAAGFTQGFVDGFNKYYFFGISCDSGAIVHNYYSHVVAANLDFGYHRVFELVGPSSAMGSGWFSVASAWGQAEF